MFQKENPEYPIDYIQQQVVLSNLRLIDLLDLVQVFRVLVI